MRACEAALCKLGETALRRTAAAAAAAAPDSGALLTARRTLSENFNSLMGQQKETVRKQ